MAEMATMEASSFCLSPVKSTSRHPFRPVGVPGGVDLRNEVLVAREDDDEHEVAGEGQVHQRQDAENRVALGGAGGMGDEVHQLGAELEQQHEQRDHQPEIKRGP